MSFVHETLAPPKSDPVSAEVRSDELMDRVVQGAHEAVDVLAAKAAPAVASLKGSVAGASEALQARAERFGELSDEWAETMRTTVREHPLAAVAVALAVGALVSRITVR